MSGQGKFPFNTSWASTGSSLLYRPIRHGTTNATRDVVFNDFFFGATGSTVYTLTASGGSYALSGNTAILNRNRNLTSSGGSYSITGSDATILKSKLIIAESGVYNYTGQDISITYVSGTTVYTLTALPGSYALSGQNAVLYRHMNLTASGGSYSITGQDVTISKHRQLNPLGGTYTLTGSNATITWSTPGGILWPPENTVLLGTVYGPTGVEYTGTLDAFGIKYDIVTGQLVKPINDKVVMTI